jgi:hypothetical protein
MNQPILTYLETDFYFWSEDDSANLGP